MSVWPAILTLRRSSIIRAVVLALGAFLASLGIAGFPAGDAPHASVWQAASIPFGFWSMVETLRCLGPVRNLYHAGVLILLISEMMILGLALFLLVFP